jgi:glutathione synthase/RimK-type ligase-like ATP-grasp enzyme
VTPLVLLAATLEWPNAARLAIAFRDAGFAVDVVAPAGHLVHAMTAPRRTFLYRAHRAAVSLRRAIEMSQPDLIVPCDDRAVRRLHQLHAQASRSERPRDSASIPALIERSLGPPASFPIVRKRDSLAALAALEDVRAPPTDSIRTVFELRRWVAEHGLPAMLKLDGTSGGEAVVPVYDSAKLGRAFLGMRLRRAGLSRLKHARQNKDVHLPFDYLSDGAPGISVQAYVWGRPANCAVACWRGDTLAATAVETVRLQTTFGASSVVRVVEGAQMKAAARAIVRHLGLSGMCGFDFMLDDVSGAAHLIEVNPRATQVNHLRLGAGNDLPTALRLALEGLPQPVAAPVAEMDIALFPQEWSRDRNSAHLLATGYDDVPYEEPELLRRYGYPAPLSSSSTLEASIETGMARLLRFVRLGDPRARRTAR